MASNRFSVAPTVTVLAGMKARLAGATKGHALLKKKADALSVKFRQILKLIVQTKEAMGRTMKDAAFALTEAKYAAGDFRYHLFALGLPKSAPAAVWSGLNIQTCNKSLRQQQQQAWRPTASAWRPLSRCWRA